MLFINRKNELGELNKLYCQKNSQLIVTFGRRRVGKSTLLKKFCEDKYHFYFTGRKKETQAQVFNRLLKELAHFFDNTMIAKLKLTDWQEVFELVDQENKKTNKKLIIVFDEFQWMCSNKSNLISALQEYWDNKWKQNNNTYLILCGSIISFMEQEILSEKSPLFGRRTLSLKIDPMKASEAKLFFKTLSEQDQAEIIMTLGGIPSYLEILDHNKSLKQNLNHQAFTKNGYFVEEINYLLNEQLKKPKKYYLLLECLAQKALTRNELAKAMHIKNSGALNLYLKTLTILDLIRCETPITANLNSKTQKYKLWDEYIRFYFTFIQPHLDQIKFNEDNEWVFDKWITPTWQLFCGYGFELLCKKNIKAIIKALGIKDVFKKQGVYWRQPTKAKQGVQIDLVIERTDNITHIIECKWSNGKIGKSIIPEINNKKKLYPNPHNHTLKTTLITTIGATKDLLESNIIDDVITIKDLLA